MLMLKFVDRCKDRVKSDALKENGYTNICPGISRLRPMIKTTIQRLQLNHSLCYIFLILHSINNLLPTTFLDNDTVMLEKNDERDKVIIIRNRRRNKLVI